MKKIYSIFLLLGCMLSAPWVEAALPYPIDTIDGQLVYRYTVEKSIGLYRIGINFHVSQEEIIQMNPVLKERGLHYGEVIFIPVKDTVVKEVQKVQEVQEVQEDAVVPIVAIDTIVAQDMSAPSDSTGFHIALLLPLQAEALKRDMMSERFMEFYEGVLMALYMLPDTNHFYLHVFDIGRTDEFLKKLIADGQLTKMNAIFGPAYPAQVATVAPLSLSDSIPTVIPFIDKVAGIAHNPFLFQFNPTVGEETTAVGEYLEANRDSINCVLIDTKEADIPYSIRQIRQEIRNRHIPSTHISMHELLIDSLASVLVDGKENIVFLNTEKYANAQVFFSHLINGKKGHKVTLFSQYAWQDEKIVLPQLYTSAFAANQPQRLEQYERIYSQYFQHEHASVNPRYDLLGYDLTNCLLAWLRGDEYHGIQSEIKFEQLPNDGGYINTNVQIIRK